MPYDYSTCSAAMLSCNNDLILLDNVAVYFGVKMRGVNSEVTGGGYSSIQCTCWSYGEANPSPCGLKDIGNIPNGKKQNDKAKDHLNCPGREIFL